MKFNWEYLDQFPNLVPRDEIESNISNELPMLFNEEDLPIDDIEVVFLSSFEEVTLQAMVRDQAGQTIAMIEYNLETNHQAVYTLGDAD